MALSQRSSQKIADQALQRRTLNSRNFDAVVLRRCSSQKIEGQALQRRNAELEVEIRKLNRRLQRAELILEIQKNSPRARSAPHVCRNRQRRNGNVCDRARRMA